MEITIDNKVYILSIEKAKECGALTRKDTRVKSWEEYLTKHKNSPAYIYEDSEDDVMVFQQLTTKDAEAIWALSRLMKLRRDWVGDWEPKCDGVTTYYAIEYVRDQFIVANFYSIPRFLSFPTKEDAALFLKCFRDLIEMCKNYI